MLYKDSPRIKIGIVLIYSNYNIATNTHSKTVIYNHLRMYDVKTNFCFLIYKIATAPYSKSVLENCRSWRVVNSSFCSSVFVNSRKFDIHSSLYSSRHSFCHRSFGQILE